MLYKFNDISDEGLSLNVPLSADWLKEECPHLEAKPAREGLTFRGHLSRQGDDAFLRGTLSGVFDCSCSRCLEPAKLPVVVKMTALAPGVVEERRSAHVAAFVPVALDAAELLECFATRILARHAVALVHRGLALDVVRELFVDVRVGAATKQQRAQTEPEGRERFHVSSVRSRCVAQACMTR